MADFSNQFNNQEGIVTICDNCQKEKNIDGKKIEDLGWKISHGRCPRHTKRYFAMAGLASDKVKELAEKSTIKDLSVPENKPLLDWFLNPKPPEKAAA